MSLIVEDLSCRRAGHLVFAGLSFRLAPGEIRLLRGPNGVGKSSLLRMLAGLVPSAAGGISLDGVEPRDLDAWVERVAYAGHLDAIKPQLSVAENLRFWATLGGGGGAKDALEAFGLTAIAGRPAHACSAGQKRRLGLARLLVGPRRALWLLDEPTVALDLASVQRFSDAVAAHAAGGGLALIATHVDLPLAAGPDLVLTAPEPAAVPTSDPFLEGAFA
jgi:heme exporter protein A